MAQSDYLQYKKVSHQLRNLSDYGNVIDPSTYMSFKNYTLENTVKDTNIMYTKLLPPTHQNVFGMNKFPTNCPTYPLCKNTQTRVNRVLVPLSYSAATCTERPMALKTAKKLYPAKYSVSSTNFCLQNCLYQNSEKYKQMLEKKKKYRWP
jgi:hypothetical protein